MGHALAYSVMAEQIYVCEEEMNLDLNSCFSIAFFNTNTDTHNLFLLDLSSTVRNTHCRPCTSGLCVRIFKVVAYSLSLITYESQYIQVSITSRVSKLTRLRIKATRLFSRSSRPSVDRNVASVVVNPFFLWTVFQRDTVSKRKESQRKNI